MFDIREYQEAQKEVPAVKCENAHQKAVFTNCYYAACEYIGGLENILQDFDEDDEEYINAEEELSNHEALVEYVFSSGITNEYGCGFSSPGKDSQKHYRFAGKAFTMNACEEIVKAMGY